jgi:drug/metabolite transporter (DMT)-like permease
MCVAVAIFAVQDTTSKAATVIFGLPVLQVVAMRFIVNVVINALYLGPHNVPKLLRSARPGMQLLRGGVMSLSTLLNFTALKYLRMDQTIAITFLTPLLVALLAGPLLGEWVGWRRMVAIVVGFLGVAIVVRPDIGFVHWAMLLSIAATFCYALYNIATRYMAPLDSAAVMQFYTPLGGLILFGPTVFFVWETPQSFAAWSILIACGLLGSVSHWFLILAHRLAPASLVAPFVYTEIVWIVALGALIFGDWPDAWTLAGATIVIASGLYLLYRETVRARQQRSEARAGA